MIKWNDYKTSNLRYENVSNFIAPKEVFFSQSNQDKSLEQCIFKGYKNGTFMDVGAHDGVDLNNTLYFEVNNDWKGINIEPNHDVFKRLITNRPSCININCAIDETIGQELFTLNHGYTEMLSGIKKYYPKEQTDRIEKENKQYLSSSTDILVETKTIDYICDQYDIKQINYLSVDAEGSEFPVLKSVNYEKVFIDVIGFECNYSMEYSAEIINFLRSKNFILLPDHYSDIFMINSNSKFIKNMTFF